MCAVAWLPSRNNNNGSLGSACDGGGGLGRGVMTGRRQLSRRQLACAGPPLPRMMFAALQEACWGHVHSKGAGAQGTRACSARLIECVWLAACLARDPYYGTGTYCTIRLYEYSEGHACNDWKALGGYTMCGPRYIV
jgi:hypothetical protein